MELNGRGFHAFHVFVSPDAGLEYPVGVFGDVEDEGIFVGVGRQLMHVGFGGHVVNDVGVVVFLVDFYVDVMYDVAVFLIELHLDLDGVAYVFGLGVGREDLDGVLGGLVLRHGLLFGFALCEQESRACE